MAGVAQVPRYNLFTGHLCTCYIHRQMVPRYFVLKPPDETFSQELKQMYYVGLNAVITTVTNFRIFQITTTCEAEPESL